MDDISDLRLFAGLVANGGLSAAARALNSSPPAMSRRLAALEDRLGVRLITRSPRRFELTEEGTLFYERSLRIIAEIDEAEAEASSKGGMPRGLLRVAAHTEIGRRQIAPLISDFTALYPKVHVQLILSDYELDVIEDGLDLALRGGLPPQSGVIATKLFASRRVVCATPDYLKRHGQPATPNDLLRHNCICLVRGRRVFDHWLFKENGKPREFRVQGTLSTTSGEVLHDWALAGKGLAFKVHWDLRADLEAGRLVECLAEFACDDVDFYAVYASRQHLAPRIRVFIDFVRERIAER